MADRAKVFGIGFHKTATTSLQAALTHLGYRVTGPDWVRRDDVAENVEQLCAERAHEFDAFQDNPWPLVYRQMDELFPGSKFVLTVRDDEKWLASAVKHFSGRTTAMREWIYDGIGDPAGNEAHYLEYYRRHNSGVREHFRDRPDDLLVMDITKGDGWEKLCPFLGYDVPNIPFPTANTAAEREAAERQKRSPLRRVKRLTVRLVDRLKGGLSDQLSSIKLSASSSPTVSSQNTLKRSFTPFST